MNKPTQLLSVQAMTALLAACGGGGTDQPESGSSNTSEGNSIAISRDIEAASYSITGNIVVQSDARHDADTNDYNNANGSNNSLGAAQTVATQSTVSGYVNVAGSGNDGYSYSTGDSVDYFHAELGNNQTISLDIANTASDLDLFVYDSSDTSTYSYSSATSNDTESITIAAAGDYYIKVVATSGASNYILDLDQGVGPSSVQAASMDFIPGEIIVQYRDPYQARSLSAFASDTALAEVISVSDVLGDASASAFSTRSLLSSESDAQLKQQTLEAVEILRQREDVAYAEPNFRVYPAATPSDPSYSRQSHYDQIELPDAWDLSTGSSDVTVAVIDTGIITDHPDLAARLVDGYDFVSNASYSEDGDGIDNDPYDEGDPSHGIAYHGTHVAGTIGAIANNSEGVSGIAWNTRLMPLRAITYEHGSTSDLAQAIRYAAGLSNSSGTLPSVRADIINLSVGTSSNNTTLRQAIEAARAAGVIIVAAAGNNATSTPHYPAAYGEVLSVSAVTTTNQLASFSNYGSTISIAAPGVNIYSTKGDSNGIASYGYMSGTSMATPHVSGVLALMKAVNPQLTPDDVDALLVGGSLTDDAGTTGKDNSFGYGIIDAYQAVYAAQAPYLQPGTYEMHLGLQSLPQNLTLEGYVPSGQSVTVEASHPWLSAAPYSVDGSGVGTYQVSVNRSTLSDGAYEGQLTFRLGSSVSQVVTVRALEATVEPQAALGSQYIGLRLSGATEPAYQLTVSPSNGTIAFNFTNVETGRYYLVTGSDENNNGVICEKGESCGQYPSLSNPIAIDITEDMENMDLVTSIDTSGSYSFRAGNTQ